MGDGVHTVRLVLRDRNGNLYRESKTFMIVSKPPVVNIKIDRRQFHRGDAIHLKVSASANTRTLIAQLEGSVPIHLYWNPDALSSTGDLPIPEELSPGTYHLTVMAEDMAHNIGAQEVQIEILP
jgi:Ca-activated chloride channel family protein